MSEIEFKEKTRRHIFNCGLKEFPVVFEMYVRALGLEVDISESMSDIIDIIRTSENQTVAYTMVCHYLDALEK